jgi:hypothetical protein
MLTFKQFLSSQVDDIEDMEAVRKYQEYKLDFRKTQIADFFTAHKEEEWYVYIKICFDCLSNYMQTRLFLREYVILPAMRPIVGSSEIVCAKFNFE